MLLTSEMSAREAPLCLEHFLLSARIHLQEVAKINTIKEEAPAPTRKTTFLSPQRVQPRRAAKNKTPVWADAALSKSRTPGHPEEAETTNSEGESDESSVEDSSDNYSSEDDKPIPRKRARQGVVDPPYKKPGQPPSKRRKSAPSPTISMVQRQKIDVEVRRLQNSIDGITAGGYECIFGAKPWVCTVCERQRLIAAKKIANVPLFASVETASPAFMSPQPCEVLWKWDVIVPEDQRFHWRGMDFTVDTCGKVMLLML